MIMNKYVIVFINLFLLSFNSFGQGNLKIYYSGALTSEQIYTLESFVKKSKHKGEIYLENIYNKNLIFKYNKSNNKGERFENHSYGSYSLNSVPVNKEYIESIDVLEAFNDNRGNKLLFNYSSKHWRTDLMSIDYPVLEFNDIKKQKKLKTVFKRKAKKSIKALRNKKDALMMFANESVDYIYSCARLEKKCPSSSSVDCSTLHVSYNFDDTDLPMVRPSIIGDVEYYKFEVDTVGLFDSYQIQLSTFHNGGVFEMFNEIISISEKNNDNYYFSKSYSSEKLFLNIKALFIAEKILEVVPSLSVEEAQNDCETCRFKRIYEHKYKFNIRGYSTTCSDDRLWHESSIFLMQCLR